MLLVTDELLDYLRTRSPEAVKEVMENEVLNGFILGMLASGNTNVKPEKLLEFGKLVKNPEEILPLVEDQEIARLCIVLHLPLHLYGFALGYLCPKEEGE